ncbi:glycerol-3-phosphate acyltransferase 2, mitochondrial isoform X8 [Canis lupus familiaris]|uniref:glycerol-3-phosphate acyltransferase 2, mitochondrial isoform X8 n=1 Tax=Canis lupus familiaris TaxID=9615 RepID=UPI0015F14A15|nr:glycerol-3-phosphate acyltransferase 2, mitochondrial isoform X8 [Canis lupus familiaris]XP_038417319.1 glycerol-3-phosphate acyltransferase 2, mitochondrial isoform X8 [Canis lupus familiaris]
MDTMLEARLQTQQRNTQNTQETSLWSSGFGMKLETVTPFLGKYRPFVGRCCQTCTPKSWESLFHRSIMDLGFCNVILVKEENTRFRGWLVRRLCYFLWSLEQHIPPCQDAPQKIIENTGLFSWALLRFLNCVFLNVQLHKGQMKMVHKAAQAGLPLVFLSTHKSLLDGILLPFVLFSQGLGVLRVAWDPRTCSPALRALLKKLGGLFLPPEANLTLDSSEGVLARAVVHAAIEQLLVSRQPLLIFLEELPGAQGPRLSALGQTWLGLVVQAVQVGVVPDAMLVPVAITYDLVPDAPCDVYQALAPLGLWTGALAVLRSLRSWGHSPRVCVRVHLAQPFSLQEYTINARSCWGSRQTLEQLLQPIVLGQCTVVPDTEKEQDWTPATGLLLALKEEDQLLVRRLSHHVLNASVTSSAVMSTAIMATLLLFKHQKGVFLSQLLGEFSWLTEETLLRGFDVGFSGQLRCLVQHTLSLLQAHVALLHVQQGDLLVVPRLGPGLTHLARLSAELLPAFLSEAVGACAVRGLLAGRVPPEGPWELQGIELLSQNELYRQILLLLHLLPQDLLLLQPCQSSYCYCQEVLDRLIQCGLLVAEETPGSRPACDTGRQRLSAKLLWKPSGDFTDSDSDDFEEAEGRYFRLSQQSRCPDFFLFLCRLLSPLLKAFAQAATFLHQGQLPDTELGYTEQLLQFLQANAQEEGFFECADPNLAVSAIWTFRDLGVLQQTPSPAGPMLYLSPTFTSRENQEKLEQFIRQFICS